jgi:hypothetical protein
VAGLLRAGHQFDGDALVRQVTGYLAGPAGPLWQHLVLDIAWGLPTPIEIAGWQLRQPSSDDWNALRPVPAAAEYAAEERNVTVVSESTNPSFENRQPSGATGRRFRQMNYEKLRTLLVRAEESRWLGPRVGKGRYWVSSGRSDGGGAAGTRTHDLTDYETVRAGSTGTLPGQTATTKVQKWA